MLAYAEGMSDQQPTPEAPREDSAPTQPTPPAPDAPAPDGSTPPPAPAVPPAPPVWPAHAAAPADAPGQPASAAPYPAGSSGQPNPGQPVPPQGYPPQGYPAQPYPAQPYPPQPYPGQAYPYAPMPTTSTNAIVGLVLAVLSWVLCPIVPAIVALVLARQSDREIQASGGTVGGEGLNTATRVVSWINIGVWGTLIVVFAGFFLVLFVAGIASSPR